MFSLFRRKVIYESNTVLVSLNILWSVCFDFN